MSKRRHPPTDKIARPLEWHVEEQPARWPSRALGTQRGERVTSELVGILHGDPVTIHDEPTMPIGTPWPRVPLRISAAHVPPRIAGTPMPAPRIAGTPMPRGSSPQIGSTRMAALPVAVAPAVRSRREGLMRFGYFLAGAALAVGLVTYGEQLWKTRHEAAKASAAPMLVPGCLLATTTQGAQTRVRCIAIDSGAVRWTIVEEHGAVTLEMGTR